MKPEKKKKGHDRCVDDDVAVSFEIAHRTRELLADYVLGRLLSTAGALFSWASAC